MLVLLCGDVSIKSSVSMCADICSTVVVENRTERDKALRKRVIVFELVV